jgi:MFS family permease
MACLVYSGLVGMLPAGVLGGAPVFAPSPRQIGTTNGLLVQGSHLGQFIGPPLIAAVVFMAGGWQGGAWVFAICGAGAFLFSILIGREEKRLTH